MDSNQSTDTSKSFILPVVRSLTEEKLTSTGTTPSRLTSKKVRHIVIHFDINETILVSDDAGGDSNEDCLHKMLAKSAYVQLPEGAAAQLPTSARRDSSCLDAVMRKSKILPTHWWDGTPLVKQYNDFSITTAAAVVPPLYTGWEWPENSCMYYRVPAFKRTAKTFVKHHGSIYRKVLEKLEQVLKHDHHQNDSLAAAATESNNFMLHLLPAFYETLIAITQDMKDHPNRLYTIVFRTMGSDLENVADAVTAFATGQHPDYPDFSNPNLILTHDKLYKGKWAECHVDETFNDSSSNSDQKQSTVKSQVYQLSQQGHIVASNDAQVLNILHSSTICGIRDDYAFWKKHEKRPWAGKPVWILNDDYDDLIEYHHILLDDNIHNLNDYSIASVRRQVSMPTKDSKKEPVFETFSSQEIAQQHGRHLLRVPTIEPIFNNMWFWEQIQHAASL